MRKKKNPRRKTWRSKTQQLSHHSKSRSHRTTATKTTIVSNHLHIKDHSAKEAPLTNKIIINRSNITIGRVTKSLNLRTKTIDRLPPSLANSNLGRVTPQTTPKSACQAREQAVEVDMRGASHITEGVKEAVEVAIEVAGAEETI